MLYFVVRQDGITDELTYCGQPCHTEEEARELIWIKTYNAVHHEGLTLEEPVPLCFWLIDHECGGAILETYYIFKAGREV